MSYLASVIGGLVLLRTTDDFLIVTHTKVEIVGLGSVTVPVRNQISELVSVPWIATLFCCSYLSLMILSYTTMRLGDPVGGLRVLHFRYSCGQIFRLTLVGFFDSPGLRGSC